MLPDRFNTIPTHLLKALNEGEKSWFIFWGLNIASILFAQPDIRYSRILLSNLFRKVCNTPTFFNEAPSLKPSPDELNRMAMIEWLEHISVSTGLLSEEEIRLIETTEGKKSPGNQTLIERKLSSFEEVASNSDELHRQNKVLGFYHGAWDPPTLTHLACLTEAARQCDYLIVGFDNDILLRSRKGIGHPRYPLVLRRQILEGFWMVGTTVELRAKSVEDRVQYATDYQALHASYVFLSENQEEIEERLLKIELGGAQPKFIKHRNFHSTQMLELAKQWRFLTQK